MRATTTTINLAGAINRSQYYFTYWKASNGSLYSAGASYKVTANTTMTAQWAATSFDLSPSVINFTDTKLRETVSIKNVKPTSLSVIAKANATWFSVNHPPGQNYFYVNTSENSGAARSGTISVTGNGVTKIIQVTQAAAPVKYYTVSYSANGGSSTPSPRTVASGTTINLASAITRTGYKFDGWKASSGSGSIYDAGEPYKVISNTTMTAQWTQNASFDVSPPSQTVPVNEGSFTIRASNVIPAGLSIGISISYANPNNKDWLTYSSGGAYSNYWTIRYNTNYSDEARKATITLGGGGFTRQIQVTQAAPVTYTVSYSANGGSSTPPSQTVASGTTINLASAITKTGYKFDGWKASSGTTIYAAGQSYKVTSNTTMTAQWSVGNGKCEISFNRNFGVGDPFTPIPANMGSVVELPDGRYQYDPFVYESESLTFAGWNTEQNGAGKTYSYGKHNISDFEYVTYVAPYAEKVTLYADWKIVIPIDEYEKYLNIDSCNERALSIHMAFRSYWKDTKISPDDIAKEIYAHAYVFNNPYQSFETIAALEHVKNGADIERKLDPHHEYFERLWKNAPQTASPKVDPVSAPSVWINPSSDWENVPASGGTRTTTVDYYSSFSVDAPSWITVSGSGQARTLAAAPNAGSARSAVVTFTSDDASNSITVSQAPSVWISPSTDWTNVPYAGGAKTITVSYYTSFTVEAPSWVTVSGSGQTRTLTASANTGAARSGVVTFKSGAAKNSFTISQLAGTITVTVTDLVTPNWTESNGPRNDGWNESVSSLKTGGYVLFGPRPSIGYLHGSVVFQDINFVAGHYYWISTYFGTYGDSRGYMTVKVGNQNEWYNANPGVQNFTTTVNNLSGLMNVCAYAWDDPNMSYTKLLCLDIIDMYPLMSQGATLQQAKAALDANCRAMNGAKNITIKL